MKLVENLRKNGQQHGNVSQEPKIYSYLLTFCSVIYDRSAPEQPRTSSSGAPGQIDIQRQLDALNVAERLRAVAVPSVNNNAAAAGNVANSSGSTLPTMSSSLGNFFIQANPNIGPLFQQDEHRGKGVLLRILAELHTRKGRPLPPGLTGMPVPMWNPAASTFRFELGVERGVVKIAGHDVDLFKLWQAIFHAGLLGKVCRTLFQCHLHVIMSSLNFPRSPVTGSGHR